VLRPLITSILVLLQVVVSVSQVFFDGDGEPELGPEQEPSAKKRGKRRVVA
jgi:hypothetical protein